MTVRKERDGKGRKKRTRTAGQVRMEELLAKADAVDGRKEWYCRFCSEANVHCKVSTSRLFQPRLVGVVRTRPQWASGKAKVLAHKARWAKETELRELLSKKQEAQETRKEIVGVV